MKQFLGKFPGKSGPAAVVTIAVGLVLTAYSSWPYVRAYRISHDPVALENLKNMAGLGESSKELETLDRYARDGVGPAQRALGEVFLTSRQGTHRQQAVAWLQAAADQGDGMAAFDLGKVYFFGQGVAQDYVAARHWFGLASGDSGRAAYYLGLIYRNAYGVAADPVQARQWFERAAGQGQTDAMFMLANSWRFGEGGAQDEAQALKLYRQAGEGEHEHPVALQTLALVYLNGELGETRDEARFQHYLAEAGHALKHYVAP